MLHLPLAVRWLNYIMPTSTYTWYYGVLQSCHPVRELSYEQANS